MLWALPKKDKNLNLGDKKLSLDLNNLLNHFKQLNLRGEFRTKLEKNLTQELVKYFETFEQDTPAERGKVDHDDFVKKVGELEKKCREAKQKFKDKVEKVYKLLKSCIKKLEKRNSSKGIATVLKSEISAFKEYEINLDKIIEKIEDEKELENWEIVGLKKPKGKGGEEGAYDGDDE